MKSLRLQALRLVAALMFACQFFTIQAFAQWSTNTTVNNAICEATLQQRYPTSVTDGAGGAIITWYDYRSGSGSSDIYAQRINAAGAVQWTADGVAICTAADNQEYPTIVSDGAGGAIITWCDYRLGSASEDIYAQRINAAGTVLWTADGVALCNATDNQTIPVIVSDGAGGAIITWYDLRSGTSTDIYAQRINASGVVQWTADGVAISVATGNQLTPTIVSDGAAGAIITWYDTRNTNEDIYAQRISGAGAVQWTADGVAICISTNNQEFPAIVGDGLGGAIITWDDYRNSTSYSDIYAQRINTSGVVQWAANGVATSTATDSQYDPKIVSDGANGAIITWRDYRTGNDWDIYAQRVNSSGAAQWTSGGVAVSTATGDQSLPKIVSDGANGAVITWYDNRLSLGNIYASRVFSNGTLPIQLASFTVVINGNHVLLQWTTSTEINNYGFEIERSENLEGKDENWEKISFVAGNGTSNAPKEYSFFDKNLSEGRYSYRLKQIDRDGQFKYSQSIEVRVGVTPRVFVLSQNYPNPFNPSTVISYHLPAGQAGLPVISKVTLRIYDVLGRDVATLVNEEQSAGWKEVQWNAVNVASGIYFYRIEAVAVNSPARSFVQMRKMMLLR